MSDTTVVLTFSEWKRLTEKIAELSSQLASAKEWNRLRADDIVALGQQIARARRDAIEECATHLERCGYRYSPQGFDILESLRKFAQTDETGKI